MKTRLKFLSVAVGFFWVCSLAQPSQARRISRDCIFSNPQIVIEEYGLQAYQDIIRGCADAAEGMQAATGQSVSYHIGWRIWHKSFGGE